MTLWAIVLSAVLVGIAVGQAVMAMLLAQALYPAALLTTATLHRVKWRGVCYRIKSPKQIHLLRYEPYKGGTGTDQTAGSL